MALSLFPPLKVGRVGVTNHPALWSPDFPPLPIFLDREERSPTPGPSNYIIFITFAVSRGFSSSIELAKTIFSKISYTVGARLNEATFHSLFYLMVNAGGTPADMELLTSRGRIDMVVEYRDRVYIIEFKCNQSAEKAIGHIKEKEYYRPFLGKGKEVVLLGNNFDTESRNIKE